MKLPETVALLSEILGNSFTALDIEEIPPILEVEEHPVSGSTYFLRQVELVSILELKLHLDHSGGGLEQCLWNNCNAACDHEQQGGAWN